jgi:hypothetical protein
MPLSIRNGLRETPIEKEVRAVTTGTSIPGPKAMVVDRSQISNVAVGRRFQNVVTAWPSTG